MSAVFALPYIRASRLALFGGILVGLMTPTTLRAQVPTASFLTPASANAGDPGLTLSVVGGGFAAGSVVFWSSQALTTTLVSANQLSAVVPAQLLTSAGQFSISVVNPNGARSLSLPFTVNGAPVSITTTTLPAGQARVSYSQTLAAVGGTPPYTWSAVDSLPAGLALSTSGQLTGAAASAGNFSFTVRVSDAAQHSAAKPLSVVFATPPLSISTP